MAGTINYLYDPNQTVWIITPCAAGETDTTGAIDIKVNEGVVIRIRSEVLLTGQDLEYDVQIAGVAGTTASKEADVFASLVLATDEYNARLT